VQRGDMGPIRTSYLGNLAKTTAIALLMFVAAASAQDEPPVPASTADRSLKGALTAPADDVLRQGRYLATAANCISCHTRPGGPPFAGGLAFQTPLGTIYSSNITPDFESGIGKWSEADLIRAMHEGIAPDGHRLYPAFPYTSFTKVTDADVQAIYAYLRTLRPVRYTPPSNDIAFNQRWTMIVWNALFFKPGRYTRTAAQSAEWNRGAYLSEGLGHCGACHTPRNLSMAEIADRAFAGGDLQDKVTDNRIRRWSAVNLTPSSTGLGSWSVGDIARYLQTGFSQHGGAFGPMNDVISNSTRYLSMNDLHAVATFIKSLPPQESLVEPKPSADQLKSGEAIYRDRCEKCHLTSGRGGLFNGPRLAGSAVVQAVDPASLVNVILYGAQGPPVLGAFGGWETMNSYANILSDEQIAALCNYVRNTWGNRGNLVTASDVGKQR
jgi:alcohol dehydrogenase (quinone), cytochrome c subunit